MTVLVNLQNDLIVRECFEEILKVRGILVVGLGNWQTQKCLAYDGVDSPDFPNLKVPTAIAGNSRVIQEKLKTATDLGFPNQIEEIIFCLPSQWHLVKPLTAEGFFLYIALDRGMGSMVSASFQLMQANRRISALLGK